MAKYLGMGNFLQFELNLAMFISQLLSKLGDIQFAFFFQKQMYLNTVKPRATWPQATRT
jgi:hypothetical protein